MNLTLPFTAEDLKGRYRKLAKQWHPDLNPENPNAEERMKALTGAAEILTGIEPGAIPSYVGATFKKAISQEEFTDGNVRFTMSAEMQVSEMHAADWIYAANFAGRTHDVFLAGYSGKIV
jgi:DnaJ-class molecular chaperone